VGDSNPPGAIKLSIQSRAAGGLLPASASSSAKTRAKKALL